MGRYHIPDIEIQPNQASPEPAKYFCIRPGCNHKQIISYEGQQLIPCPKCGGKDFSTV